MIDLGQIHWLAVALGAVTAFLLGGIWYTFLFSKPWLAAMGISHEDVGDAGLSMARALIGSFLASTLTAIGVAALLSGSSALSWSEGLMVCGLVWLAFSVSPLLKLVFWEDRPWTLFAINSGYELASILSVFTVVQLWR